AARDRECRARHDRRTGRTASSLRVERERARDVARERRFPRQERVRERRRLRLLTDAVGGEQRQYVATGDIEQACTQPSDLGEHDGQPCSEVEAPRDRVEIAGAAAEVDPAGGGGAELLCQIRLARMASAAHRVANRFDPLRLHLAQACENCARSIPRNQSRFGQRNGMGLIECMEGRVAPSQASERPRIETPREARIDLTGQARAGLTDDVGHCTGTPRRADSVALRRAAKLTGATWIMRDRAPFINSSRGVIAMLKQKSSEYRGYRTAGIRL